MKKMLSLFLALLVMAVPALSTAESCPFSLSWLPARQSFVSPDLSDGQQLTLDLSVQPGSALLDVLPEEVRVPVQDLLSALTVEMSGWYSETAAQGSLRLLLNGESALDITGEAGQSGIFLASSLYLGRSSKETCTLCLRANVMNSIIVIFPSARISATSF